MSYHRAIVDVLTSELYEEYRDRARDDESANKDIRVSLLRAFEDWKKDQKAGWPPSVDLEFKSYLDEKFPLPKLKKSSQKPEKDDLWQDQDFNRYQVLGYVNEENTKENPLQVLYKSLKDQKKMTCPYKQWHKRFYFIEEGE